MHRNSSITVWWQSSRPRQRFTFKRKAEKILVSFWCLFLCKGDQCYSAPTSFRPMQCILVINKSDYLTTPSPVQICLCIVICIVCIYLFPKIQFALGWKTFGSVATSAWDACAFGRPRHFDPCCWRLKMRCLVLERKMITFRGWQYIVLNKCRNAKVICLLACIISFVESVIVILFSGCF